MKFREYLQEQARVTEGYKQIGRGQKVQDFFSVGDTVYIGAAKDEGKLVKFTDHESMRDGYLHIKLDNGKVIKQVWSNVYLNESIGKDYDLSDKKFDIDKFMDMMDDDYGKLDWSGETVIVPKDIHAKFVSVMKKLGVKL